MKRVKGGHDPVHCLWTMDGDNGCTGGQSVLECNSSAEDCQWAADLMCGPNNCCTYVDCR
jgi:hypothetical protein